MDELVPDLRRSDQFPFWCERTPAVVWTDTGDVRTPHCHQRTNTPETLDYALMPGVGERLASARARRSP